MNVENNEQEMEEVSVGDPVDPTAAGSLSNDEPDQLRIACDGLKVERDELKELLLRRQAEFDNFRKRTERERSEYLQYGSMEMVKGLLPVLDDFERALKTEAGSQEYARAALR